ncbi:VapE domain-containing protein [Dysgonomonas sp. HGC4]|uniref:VapE domain-containing protein n=1 Tax=Dysgonomonas sp. HGC4 TaxID=1658009 RepID=UPI000681C800|nr:VapE domain-containing protein [Dysgonomonas sp. HGC4]MBD8349366.1 hypothetical protein [Dysgonomonas sp. HGC4]
MAKIEKKEISKQKSLFETDKIKDVVNFLLEHYDIRIPIQDPTKIQITCKDPDRYAFAPTFDDISLHIMSEGKNISDNMLRKIIRSPNYIQPCNPIVEYFDSIRGKYKGESHIDILCKHITPRCFDDHTPEYYRERTDKLIRKWLVACVACWIKSIPNDVALGFIHSEEGIGKTFISEFLLPETLSEYYVKSSRDDKKFDTEDVFTRYMIVTFDELVGIGKSNIDVFKSVLSAKTILNKRKHEEFPTSKARMGCGVFTTNRNAEKGGFLHDSYGYRRWGTIELENIDKNYSKVVDIDQVWSEALTLLEGTEFNYIFSEVDFEELKEYNRRYQIETDAMLFVQKYLIAPTSNEDGEKLNPTQIIQRLSHKIRKEDNSKITPSKLGAALAALGYVRGSFRPKDGGNPMYGYHIKFIE